MQPWFKGLFVLNHIIPRSNWEGHGFTSNFGLCTPEGVVSNAVTSKRLESKDPAFLDHTSP